MITSANTLRQIGLSAVLAVSLSAAGTAQAKKEALEAAGVKVGKTPSEAARLMREIMASL